MGTCRVLSLCLSYSFSLSLSPPTFLSISLPVWSTWWETQALSTVRQYSLRATAVGERSGNPLSTKSTIPGQAVSVAAWVRCPWPDSWLWGRDAARSKKNLSASSLSLWITVAHTSSSLIIGKNYTKLKICIHHIKQSFCYLFIFCRTADRLNLNLHWISRSLYVSIMFYFV